MNPLESDYPLIVYLDFKSPYAYLAKEPTAEMARELGVKVDWRPFVLDIPSYLGSAKLGRSGVVVEQNRSAEQWSGVKYAYFDCRRYANLRGMIIRGTIKIWDTNLAAIGMLWAKRQSDEILELYIDAVYEPFWKRALNVEDIDVIGRVLSNVGADVAGFEDYARGRGAAENAVLQSAAFDAGIFGVPTYIVKGEVYFGREHLPRIRWHLTGEQGSAPDIFYSVPDKEISDKVIVGASEFLEVCIDFKSPHSYMALAPTLAVAAEQGAGHRTGHRLSIDWHPKMTTPLKSPLAHGFTSDRSIRHRRFRAEAIAHDIDLYALHALRDIYADFDTNAASMGLLWLKREAPTKVDDYVERVFVRYWRDQQAIDEVKIIEHILDGLGVESGDFARYVRGEGAAALEAEERDLRARGVISTPTYLLGNELFLGRQHLPLIAARLAARG